MKKPLGPQLLTMLVVLLLSGSFVWAGETQPGRRRKLNLQPEEVLVMANSAVPESIKLARYYMDRRRIPPKNLFTIEYAEFGQLDPMDRNPRWLPFDRFRHGVVKPLEQFLVEEGLREQILCLVPVYGMPYRVGGFQLTGREEAGLRRALGREHNFLSLSPDKRTDVFKQGKRELWLANSAFDSELATLYRPSPSWLQESGYGRRMRLRLRNSNPYAGEVVSFRQFRQRQLNDDETGLLYMVARIDGLSAENAKGLIDRAIEAERNGVSGRAYFDGRNVGKKKKGYGMGDWWVRRAYEITRMAGIPARWNTDGGMFGAGECKDALIYWGFYHPFNYRGELFNDEFPAGAIACHIASFEAANIHRASWGDGDDVKMPWCSGFLRDGITVTIGPVAEPYLDAFPHTQYFFPRLYYGWSVSEAYWASIAHVSWRMILIGDPLYAPFARR